MIFWQREEELGAMVDKQSWWSAEMMFYAGLNASWTQKWKLHTGADQHSWDGCQKSEDRHPTAHPDSGPLDQRSKELQK